MTIPNRSRKGLQSIMTHADRSVRAIRPHRAFMRISAIELEKARRHTERVAILQRLQEIDDRCRDLEVEKQHLLQVLGERKPGAARPTPKGAMAAGEGKTKSGKPNDGAGPGKRTAVKQASHPSNRRAGSHISRALKQRRPEPLRPLPERTGQGLRIKY